MNIRIAILALVSATAMVLAACNSPIESATSGDVGERASVTVTSASALASAVAAANAGDTITISGTINMTSTLQLLRSGTSSAKITLKGGTLNFSGMSSGWGIKLNGSYWVLSGITVKSGPDCGIVAQLGGNNLITQCTTYANKDSGIQVYNGAHHTVVNSCISYDNYDTANGGENADGFACKLSGGAGNVFQYCQGYHNSDDGWDLYGQPYTVVIKNSQSHNNGYGSNGDGNGYKLGSSGQNVKHTVTNNNASNNKAWGFTRNGNTGTITFTGNSGSGNGAGFSDI